VKKNKIRGDYREIIGDSPQMFKIRQQIESLAVAPLKVLILGETGTGKEVVARALHTSSGKTGKMVSINCASISESLLGSELFGHEKGAFTGADSQHIGVFERADNGTLFLDEIGEMLLSIQPKLLRAVEADEIERVGGENPIPVNVRIVAATNRDLVQAVKDRTFREDLYYRLNGVVISLPPLSERREDIEALIAYFLEKHRRLDKKEVPQVAASALTLLEAYPWPGNVRELENIIKRMSYLVENGILLPRHLPEEILGYQTQHSDVSAGEGTPSVSVPLGTPLEVIEEKFIRATLAWLDGNRTKTAEVLKIGIRTLQRKLKEYGV
jgi:two-component system response regulator HydG